MILQHTTPERSEEETTETQHFEGCSRPHDGSQRAVSVSEWPRVRLSDIATQCKGRSESTAVTEPVQCPLRIARCADVIARHSHSLDMSTHRGMLATFYARRADVPHVSIALEAR